MKVAVIGLGLIEDSLGLCLKENRLISYVHGLDSSEENERDALNLGLVHELIEFENLHLCDMIFTATSVNTIIEILRKLVNLPSNATIIELGSTERKAIEKLPAKLTKQTPFAHPMTGAENSGPKAAFKELYKDTVYVLCDDGMVDDLHQKRAVEIFSHLGMRVVFMDSTARDHHTAVISHLPHVTSFSLANFVMKEEDKGNIVRLAGGSFKGMSRITKSPPVMWGSIFEQNEDNVLSSIEFLQRELEFCERMIEEDKNEELESWIQKVNALREIL